MTLQTDCWNDAIGLSSVPTASEHRHCFGIGQHRVHELAVARVVIELEAHCQRAAPVSGPRSCP